MSGLDAEQGGYQGVDIFAGVIQRQGRADRGFEAEPAQDGLCAVMSRPHRDTFLVQRLADILGAETIENEGEDTGLVFCGADQMQPRHGEQSLGCVGQQVVLVAGNILHTDLFEIVEGGAQTHCVGNVPCAGFETRWRNVVYSLLKSYVHDHAATALPWRSVVEDVALAKNHADAGGREDLVAGEDEEIAVEELYVHSHMRDGLRAIHQHTDAVAMRHFNHLPGWRDGSQRIRYLAESDDSGARAQELFIFFEDDLAAVVYRRYAKPRTLFRAQLLPGNNVCVMFEPGDDDLVVFFNVAMTPTLGDKVDTFSGAANKDDFAGGGGIQKTADFLACALVGIGGSRRKGMGGAVDVGVLVPVKR